MCTHIVRIAHIDSYIILSKYQEQRYTNQKKIKNRHLYTDYKKSLFKKGTDKQIWA